MDPEKLARLLRATFLEEMQEHVAHINRELMALEKNPPPEQQTELFKVLFRSAHTLKGSSKAVNADPIEAACHQFEEVLTAVRDGRIQLSPELFSLLFATADAIEETGMWLREEQDLSTAPLNELIPRLAEAAEGKLDAATPSEIIAPTSAETESEAEPASAAVSASTEFVSAESASAISPTSVDGPTLSPAAQGKRSVSSSNAAPSTASSSAMRRPTVASTVRVAAEKLDSLLAKSGELLVARRRVSSRATEVIELRELVSSWKNEWNRVDNLLRRHRFLDDDTGDNGPSARLPRRAAAVLAANRQRLRQLESRMERLASTIQSDSRHLDTTCDALDDEVHQVRMLPFAEACQGLERAARDVARKSGKKVEFSVEGRDVEIDRSVLEGLKDPLLHLVRNAVDHGLESTEQRAEAGKSDAGMITISAALRGTEVEVVVADDGRGVDVQRIREKVREKGLPEPSDEAALVGMLFHPSFSTAAKVTDISGRGVGLDVVQSTVESLHGTVQISFEPGKGTRFIIRVPLTLTTIRTVSVVAGGQTYGIATSSVEQLVRFSKDQLGSMGGHIVLLLKDEPLPLAALASTLGVSTTKSSIEPGTQRLAIVLNAGGRRVGVVVDEVLAEQEVVVKSLGSRIRRVRHVSGAALLASGCVMLVLNVANVVRNALLAPMPAGTMDDARTAQRAVFRLLVVDDSLTTRTLMKSILESAGYSVEVAVDGSEAWRQIQEAKPDLVVSDVDMPRMNGFELTSTIRTSAQCSDVPVILVTARQSDEDRTRGVQVGADAYILKSSFDQQELLETIAQLT